MRLLSLRLRDFRNYEEAYLEFSPGLNEFIGANAQGKSNLLEAIYLLITGRSFRTLYLEELIRFGAESFFVEATFEKHDVTQTVRMGFDGKERHVVHNSTSLASRAHLLGLLQGVLMCPEDRQLVAGAPAARRRFLDLHLAQMNPLYVHHLSRYQRALRQRNQLLKQNQLSTMEIWEQQLAQSASYLVQQRRQMVEEMNPIAATQHQHISRSATSLSINYHPSPQDGEVDHAMLTYFHRHRAREVRLGSTQTGPHRDDLQIALDGNDARHFGSEGQKATCAIALRFAEWQRLAQATSDRPILLIDDVAATLDEQRKQALMEQLNTDTQVFVASPQPLISYQKMGQRFTISNGSIYSC